MKLSSKKSTAKKMIFTPINKTALQQVKGGAGKKVGTIDDDEGEVD